MLKIFFIVMLLSPGMTQPIQKREQVASYQECLERVEKIKLKAEELNAKGGDIGVFRVVGGCEFVSEKNDPT